MQFRSKRGRPVLWTNHLINNNHRMYTFLDLIRLKIETLFGWNVITSPYPYTEWEEGVNEEKEYFLYSLPNFFLHTGIQPPNPTMTWVLPTTTSKLAIHYMCEVGSHPTWEIMSVHLRLLLLTWHGHPHCITDLFV